MTKTDKKKRKIAAGADYIYGDETLYAFIYNKLAVFTSFFLLFHLNFDYGRRLLVAHFDVAFIELLTQMILLSVIFFFFATISSDIHQILTIMKKRERGKNTRKK